MAESESGADKTEDPTEKRKKDSREKGEIARSKELNTLAIMLAGSAGLLIFGGALAQDLMELMRYNFSLSREVLLNPDSMGAFLLSAGAKGKRYALPHSEIMIHQPLGGARGQATDIKIQADLILRTRDTLNRILAANTGKTVEEIARDTERDNYMTAEEAKAYGLIDEICVKRA